MLKRIWLAAVCGLLCAGLALTGCGKGERAVFAPGSAMEDEARPSPETALVEIAGSGEGEGSPAETAPPVEAGDGVVFTPLAQGASFSERDSEFYVAGGPGQLLVDGVAFARDIRVEEGASLTLILEGGASFTGAIHSGSIQDVSVTMDANSAWILTADTGVGALVNADPTFANLNSQGFSLTYDSENGQNAYLAGAAKQLPGGGFLTPLI